MAIGTTTRLVSSLHAAEAWRRKAVERKESEPEGRRDRFECHEGVWGIIEEATGMFEHHHYCSQLQV